MSIETAAPSPTAPRSGRAPTVLCVDDEPMVLEGLFLHLRRHYKVLTERNPLNAVRLLRDHPETAVIISDMRMPGMDGATLLTTAREIAPDAVRILLKIGRAHV